MIKTRTNDERNYPRSRRMRKKLHLGEFAVQFVSFKMQIDMPDFDDEVYESWVYKLIDFADANGINVGFSSGAPNSFTFSIDKIDMTEADIELIEDYIVENTPNLIRAERTCMDDAWYPEINTGDVYEYGLVYEKHI